jgi:hypothetical protein
MALFPALNVRHDPVVGPRLGAQALLMAAEAPLAIAHDFTIC